MARISFLLPDGGEVTAEHAGTTQTVMELARRHDVPGLAGDCGGFMACATCHLHVEAPWIDVVGPASDDEREIIGLTAGPSEASRLGCQIWITDALDGLRVRVAPH